MIFTYLNCDGIHARKINQMSIIGEYLDHLIDLINAGLISYALLEDNIKKFSYINEMFNFYVTTL